MVRKFIIGLLVVVFTLSFSVRPGYAEVSSSLLISKVDVSVMPELDTEDVLVIYSIDFTNKSASDYNGEVRFAIPKGTTNNIVRESNSTTDSHIPIKVEDKGKYSEIVWNPSKSIKANESYPVHLEYYYNPMPGTGNKEFSYKLSPSSDIDQVQVNVYQPLKATDFKMEPEGKFVKKNSAGFNIYSIDPTSLRKGQNLSLEISYKKNDPEPSLKPKSATQEKVSKEKGSLSSTAILLPMIGMLIIIILIAVKAFKTPSTEEIQNKVHKKSKQINKA